MVDVTFGGVVPWLDHRGIANDQRVFRNIHIDKTVRGNKYIRANPYISNYHRSGPDPNIISYFGTTFELSSIRLADSYSMSDIAVHPNDSTFVNHKESKMSDIETGTNGGRSGNLKPISVTIDFPKQREKNPRQTEFL